MIIEDLDELEYALSAVAPGGLAVEGALWDMTYVGADGQTYLCDGADEWTVIDRADPDDCEHVETICPVCAGSWSADWCLRAVVL